MVQLQAGTRVTVVFLEGAWLDGRGERGKMAERNEKAIHLWRPALVLLGALALGGCAGTHVGDAWQCPLAQGRVCTSVAAADPAAAEPAELPALAPLDPARTVAGGTRARCACSRECGG